MTVQARHPGAGRGRARVTPKGLQADPVVAGQLRALLGEAPLQRNLLIEYLHAIQDALGRIPHAHLAALAGLLRLSMAEVFEVATFYAHFDVQDAPAPAVTIRVCDGIACKMAGAEALAAAVREGVAARVIEVPCIGRCAAAPAAQVGLQTVDAATPERVIAKAREGRLLPMVPVVPSGNYAMLAQVRSGVVDPIAVIDAAGLRGCGGAGFPTARKWRAVCAEPGPRLMAVNADEGEPGTFKDRHCIETAPHQFLEGVLIAAEIVDAETVYIYLRDEYAAARIVLQDALRAMPPGRRVELRRGAGAYVCGEESAMLESIEGKRGLPRHKPPFVFQSGLFGRPTLVNNVETLFWVPEILRRGADWWRGLGLRGQSGQRFYSVSGRVRNPGVVLAGNGSTAAELIAACGGMPEGHTLRAFLPGGASGGILPAAMADVPIGFGTLEEHGCFVGSAAVIVLSEADDLREVAGELMRFFRDESCGQCTPCRLGTEKALGLLHRQSWDRGLLTELLAVMRDASICGLGQAAPNPVLSLLRYFPEVGA